MGSAIADFAGVEAPVPVTAQSHDQIVVHYRAEAMHMIADEVQQHMLADARNSPLFCFAGRLASVTDQAPRTARELERSCRRGCVVLVPGRHWVRERMMRSCHFVIHGHGAPKKGAAPVDLADMLLSRAGAGLPPLTGVASAPTLRGDGSFVGAPGYDPATGIWLDFDPAEFAGMPRTPSRADAAAALATLRQEVFEGFPFASPADADVAALALLTGLVCRTCGPAPLFLFAAPAQGTGKSALAGLVTQLAFGREASPQPWPHDEAEREKTLLTVLKDGSTAALFDNVPDGAAIDSAALARAISGETFKARVLGASEAADVPSNALWLATGNNVRPAGDLATRTLVCELDARVERPDQRRHQRSDLAAWAAANRGRVVVAGLTILRAHAVAGAEASLKANSRFPDWDRIVRSALVWAGGSDETSDKFGAAYADDPADASRHRLLEAWAEVFDDREVSAQDVIAALEGAAPDFGQAGAAHELRGALTALGGTPGRGAPSVEWVGRVLAKIADRVVGDRRIVKWRDPVKRSARFQLQAV